MAFLIIFLFLIVTIITILNPKHKNVFFFILGLLLFLLAGFRDGTTVKDYTSYVSLYNDPSWDIEFSFSFISWIVRHFFFNHIVFLFLIYAFLGVILKLKAIEQLSTFIFFSILIYISHFYILHELTQIRVGVASGFFLLCIKPIYERNWRHFLLYSICAILFHYSAIIILPFWFIWNHKINIYVFAVLIPIAYLFYFFNINVVRIFISFVPLEHVQQKYLQYAIDQKSGLSKINVFNSVFIIKCIIYYILLWKSSLLNERNKYAPLLLKVQGIALASLIIFSNMPVFGFRISELLGIVEIITIPMLLHIFRPIWIIKIILVVIAVFMLMMNIFYVKLVI